MKLIVWLMPLFALTGACEKPDPLSRTDDLWPGLRRAAATAFPDSEGIERACAEASAHFKEEAEKTPGTYVDPTYHDYPVRNPVCEWEAASAATAGCRFEQAEIYIMFPSDRQRAEELRRMKASDWKPYRACLVHVRAGPGGSRWIAPRGCEPASAAGDEG